MGVACKDVVDGRTPLVLFELSVVIFGLAKDVFEWDGSFSFPPPAASGYASERNSIIEGERDNNVGQPILVEWVIRGTTHRLRGCHPVVD